LLKNIILVLLIIFISLPSYSKEYKFGGQHYPPFNWEADGHLYGGTSDIVKAVCQKMHVKCKIEIQPMKRVMANLERGSLDGVLSLIKNSNRDSYAILSETFIKSNMSLHAVKGTFKKITNLADLNGTLIGATSTSSAAKLVEGIKVKANNITIEYEVGLPTVIKKLSAGRYGPKGLGVANEDVAASFMNTTGIKNIEAVYVVDVGRFGVAFSKKNSDDQFISKFNETIKKMKKNGEIVEILKPYAIKADL
jgi:polar amino acid transport system substrate-binding protein